MVYKTGILLGQITKTSGFEGAVLVRLEKQFLDNLPDMESVFVEIDGRPVPFFIDWSEYNGSGVMKIKFRGYDSVKYIEEFKGCAVFLTSGTGTDQNENVFTELIGYSVINQDEQLLGNITEIISNPGQILLSILPASGREVLIPLHEDIIIRIERKNKKLFMEIPEGLTEINS
ncbi:MAG TPA: ribosome maturation factor RimM [Bacteroidales bacterium]|nr:ribosome maturation factor RimM [Bacteroidales bacterium]